MPVIVLPPTLAEKIAAGEVIERPASVVKELVENSIDAGATEIQITLNDGGKSLIEITDNGSGMPPEDLGLCVRRHATSKLKSLEDLENILTLGFRGEALPSIAAASDLKIISKAASAEAHASAFEITGGNLRPKPAHFGHFLGSTHGTQLQAANLFAQIPARLKFLRSTGSEVSHVREWIERLALARPDIGFKLLSDSRPLIDLRPQSEEDRIRAILGDGEDYPVVSASLPVASSPHESIISARVYWLQGLSTAQTRKLVQIVNGRALRDRMLQQALLTPFRQHLLPGQFPALVLFLEVDPRTIDVNVHPTKAEIRFLDTQKIFKSIDRLVQTLLTQQGNATFVSGSTLPFNLSTQTQAPPPIQTQAQSPTPSFTRFNQQELLSSHRPPGYTLPASAASGNLNPWRDAPSPAAPTITVHPFLYELSQSRYLGIAFNTYLLFDHGNELILIDQHAAHERARYEKLKSAALGQSNEAPQQLLIPETASFAQENRVKIESKLKYLDKLGFESEIFGDNQLLFRAVPAAWGTDELRIRLKNLVERLINLEDNIPLPQSLAFDEHWFEQLASEACHSAVRAGDALTRDQAIALIEDVFRCEHPWNCPHGRPTVARVPKQRFEEWFQRRAPHS